MSKLKKIYLPIFILFTGFGCQTPPMPIEEEYEFCNSVQEIPSIECNALVSIYTNLNESKTVSRLGGTWLQSNTPCSWFGVTCEDQHIIELRLFGHWISGNLSGAVGNLTQLQKLSIIGTYINELPPQIGLLQNLTELNLENTNISTLPKEIGLLQQLEILNLSYQWLAPAGSPHSMLLSMQSPPSFERTSEFTHNISSLKNLKVLHLSGNRLVEFPKEILKLNELEELDMSRNRLSTIPREISKLENLTYLDLSKNNLSDLPDSFAILSIERLILAETEIELLPFEVLQLEHLEELDLSRNCLTLRGEDFAALGANSNLKKLNLSHNCCLNTLPAEIGNLKNLEIIDVSLVIFLDVIPNELISLPNLRRVTLSRNIVNEIPTELGQSVSQNKQIGVVELINVSADEQQFDHVSQKVLSVEENYCWAQLGERSSKNGSVGE